ncbi:TonB-dependent receptor [Colwellia sp. MEBiC06753]
MKFELSKICKALTNTNTRTNTITFSLLLVPFAALSNNNINLDTIEHIEVRATNQTANIMSVERDKFTQPDIATMLQTIPGAAINRNGALTGIVQYRGLYGDRIATTVGGQTFIGAGPNAMDTPLSYSPSIITEAIEVSRGIAPVAMGIETLGGAVNTQLSQANFNDDGTVAAGRVLTGYRTVNNAKNLAAKVNIAREQIAGLIYFDSNSADDYQSGDGNTVKPTAYHKTQAGFNSRVKLGQNDYSLSYHYTDSHDSGTPALPMNITYVYGNKVNLAGQHQVTNGQFNWQLGYFNSDHEMDNFNLRQQNVLANYRRNNTDTENIDFKLHWQSNDELWLAGIDGYQSTHNATITNPNNAMFNVVNFNNVQDEKNSAFVQWQPKFDQHQVMLGARVKYISADADEVNHHMAMMNPMIGRLVNQFNNSDRHQTDTNFDLMANWRYSLNQALQFDVTLGLKQRAPSYQERYLWLPMEATGGLADGNTYVGNAELKAETAKQINLGLAYQGKSLAFSADTYFQQIDDYIQAVPNTDMTISMIASMMNSDLVLNFANVEAQLYGVDGEFTYQLNQYWQVHGYASYVRGKRDDINDNLYRITPANAGLTLSYLSDKWQANIVTRVVAKQHDIAKLNREQKTSGYGLLAMSLTYDINAELLVQAGIDNLLDREYVSHLAGYNRVTSNGYPLMSRLPQEGRNFWLSMNYQF